MNALLKKRWIVGVLLLTVIATLTRYQDAQAPADTRPARPNQLPKRYRKWQLISVAHEEGDLHDLRAILANGVAAQAFQDNAANFPKGSQIVRIAWEYSSSAENNRAFGRDQSFVAGAPTNIQLMVRDTRKYRTTDGWGYAQFAGSSAKNVAIHPSACAACHSSAKDHGFVFTHYAP